MHLLLGICCVFNCNGYSGIMHRSTSQFITLCKTELYGFIQIISGAINYYVSQIFVFLLEPFELILHTVTYDEYDKQKVVQVMSLYVHSLSTYSFTTCYIENKPIPHDGS